jgi:hypothetical protein
VFFIDLPDHIPLVLGLGRARVFIKPENAHPVSCNGYEYQKNGIN